MHNRDYDKVMNIYHEMYNIDYLDDIIKGVRQPSDILKIIRLRPCSWKRSLL